MKNLNIQKIGAAMALLFLAFLPACGSDVEADSQGLPVVVTTATMIDDLARNIGGEEVEVVSLMRTGEDPHLYDVKPKDATAIKKSDLVLYNGLNLEATLAELVKNQAGGKVVALAEHEGIEPITAMEDLEVAADPHCWMDVSIFKLYAEGTRDALSQVAPQHADLFAQRTDAYLKELDELDAYIRSRLAEIPEDQRVIITGHDAFEYYGRAYGVTLHGFLGITTDAEPKPQEIQALKQMIKDEGIRAVFPESSLSGSVIQLMKNVAGEAGAGIGGELHSDSLGAPGSGADTYITMMRHNTDTIVDALKGDN